MKIKFSRNIIKAPRWLVSNFDLNFDLGNVVKYVSRAGKKNGELAIEDLKKAQWYLNHALDCFQKEAEFNLKPPFED